MKARAFSADTVRASKRYDDDLRARARAPQEGDDYQAGDRVVTDGAHSREPGSSRGEVIGVDPPTAHEVRNNYPQQFVIELDEPLPHGRRVVSLPVTRFSKAGGA